MDDVDRLLAQVRLVTGSSADDWQAAAIFYLVRSGEGDAGRVSGASVVNQLQELHDARIRRDPL